MMKGTVESTSKSPQIYTNDFENDEIRILYCNFQQNSTFGRSKPGFRPQDDEIWAKWRQTRFVEIDPNPTILTSL